MNVVIISLERAKERRKNMINQMNFLDLDAIIMDAVDGEVLSEKEKNKYISLTGGYRHGDKFKPGEIGCTMSHIKALKTAKENNWAYVIVFEDDVVIAEDFEKRIKILLNIVPNDWEHIYLSGAPRSPQFGYSAIPYTANLDFVNVIKSPIVDCTPAMITRNVAYDKIINYWERFETTTDDSLNVLIHRDKILNSYTYFPFCVYVNDDYTFIWNKEIKKEHKSKQYFKNKI